MKRKNIKDTTIFIIGFSILFFAGIFIFMPKRMIESELSEDNNNINTYTSIWIDSLKNKDSDCAELKSMERDIRNFMNKWDIKGMSIAISRNDSLVYAKGLGWADREKEIPMEANSIMRIASASKLITAAAIMKLAEEGKLSLESTVLGPNGILNRNDFNESISDPRMETITVENLLRHQGGFTLGAGDPMFNTVELRKAKRIDHAPSNDELVKIVLQRRLGFEPGNGRKYSNFGYMLLSLVIEKVSGESYWDYVQKNILNPAGVYGFRPGTNYYEERYPNEVRYYSPDAELVQDINDTTKMVDRCYGGANIHNLLGAGGWCSSAADLCRFVASIDGDSTYPDILRKESVERMTAYKEEEKMSLGWSNADENGVWTRSGTLASAHTLIKHYPDGECWVITMNTGVWTGFRFTSSLEDLVKDLRTRYSDLLPARNLFIK